MASTPILCRICGKKMGVVRAFEGMVYTLCIPCEEARKAAKKRGEGEPPSRGLKRETAGGVEE